MKSPYWLLSALLAISTSAHAARLGSQPSHVSAELVSESTSVQPGTPVWVGLHLKMKPDWHTYWRNPGDSGMKTEVRWKLPDGYSASPFEWPAPVRIEQPPIISFGYDDEVLLLSKIEVPAHATGTAKLGGLAKWLECEKVCIPGQAEVSLELPVKATAPEPHETWASQFAATRNLTPRQDAKLQIRTNLGASRVFIEVKGPLPEKFKSAEYYPFNPDVVTGDRPVTTEIDGGYRLELVRSPNSEAQPANVDGVLTFRDGQGIRRAVELRAPFDVPSSPLPKMLFFALLGGLILNLMPCVFPLISLKVLGLVEQAKSERSKIRVHWLVFSLGTLLSFWALAVILMILKATGEKLGWGFQLQSPVFLGFLMSLFFLISLNLLGIFEVGVGMTAFGSKYLARRGYAGSFFSGVLTTLVATPCSAPFMGTAIGFALSQNPFVSLLVFTALGLGLLLPYLFLAAFPDLVRFLPRPGRWMEIFKELLAFPMLATVLWLSWTLGISAGLNAVSVAWFALLCFGLAVWGLTRLKKAGRWVGGVAALAGLLLLAMISRVPGAPLQTASAEANGDEISWRPYSKEALAELRNLRKPVFVDFTAAWCITCQVNEKLVFSSSEIKRRFRDNGIVALKADWTNRDSKIADALAEFGRSGIPLYVLYGATGDPWVLPEIITPGIVLAELDKLKRP